MSGFVRVQEKYKQKGDAAMFRVWTKNCDGGYSIMTDWMSRSKCKRFIKSRWGHWPPFAYISKARSTDNFIRYNGE